jgi:hypothetical protein
MDIMRAAAIGRHGDWNWFAAKPLDPVRLDQRIQDKSAASLALAIQAVAAIHKHRCAREPIAHHAAGASAFKIGHPTHPHVPVLFISSSVAQGNSAYNPAL